MIRIVGPQQEIAFELLAKTAASQEFTKAMSSRLAGGFGLLRHDGHDFRLLFLVLKLSLATALAFGEKDFACRHQLRFAKHAVECASIRSARALQFFFRVLRLEPKLDAPDTEILPIRNWA